MHTTTIPATDGDSSLIRFGHGDRFPSCLKRLGPVVEDEMPVDSGFEENYVDEQQYERMFDQRIYEESTLALYHERKYWHVSSWLNDMLVHRQQE
ncbi:hypothetical protein QFC19_004577 [Naganishia cerealis]|uniref:Uncharacterized protein n=1 Tax=Naganishia cerealis TaxID=610337 RepID=A0ACC2VTS4_9TREE|nr:hypothetical protein QFC19_004577 [Naganishia cerealis]